MFFALMGVMYFLTTYLQSVMGYTALEAGVRMAPIAVGLILAARLSVALTARLGAKVVVAAGLALLGALVAAAFLPSRAAGESPEPAEGEAVEEAAPAPAGA